MAEVRLVPVGGGEGLVVARDRRGWRIAPAGPGPGLPQDPEARPLARSHTTVSRAPWPLPLGAGRPPRGGREAWLLGSWVDGEPCPARSRPLGFVRVDRWLLLAPANGAPLRAFPLAWAHALACRQGEPTLFVDAGSTHTVLSAAGAGRVWPRLAACPGPGQLLERLRGRLGPDRGRGARADLPGAVLESWLAGVAKAAAAFGPAGAKRVELCGRLPAGAEAVGPRLGLPASRARANGWRGPKGWWQGAAGAAWRRAGRLHLAGAA